MSDHVTDEDPLDHEQSQRRRSLGENRLPPAAATVVAATVYALLPDDLLVGPRLAIPAIEALLLVALLVTDTRREEGERARWSRWASIALSVLVIVSNLAALAMLVVALLDADTAGEPLLLGALQVWLTNVVGFALLYWELDRGGPVARHELRRDQMPPADWRFSQDENDDAVAEVAASASGTSGWIPLFVDYLYMSLTNSSAFSPTDTMPLSTRAKLLMGLQATAALFVSLLVIARAVGSVSG